MQCSIANSDWAHFEALITATVEWRQLSAGECALDCAVPIS